jgi:hypothetical protein
MRTTIRFASPDRRLAEAILRRLASPVQFRRLITASSATPLGRSAQFWPPPPATVVSLPRSACSIRRFIRHGARRPSIAVPLAHLLPKTLQLSSFARSIRGSV